MSRLRPGIHASVANACFFVFDWQTALSSLPRPILFVGNPPWVTSAGMGVIGGDNLPSKANHGGLRGLDAMTGKSNFDIAETILLRLLDLAEGCQGSIAMLCKTSVARRILLHAWRSNLGIDAEMHSIDAKREFDVSVDSCLLLLRTGSRRNTCPVYPTFSSSSPCSEVGFLDETLIADVEDYRTYRRLRGSGKSAWRSGIKHDCAAVMELRHTPAGHVNGLGENVAVEAEVLFPLLKSSDIANGTATPSLSMIVPQSRLSQDTSELEHRAPNAWKYLCSHAAQLDARKSSIYRSRPRFAIFGVGDYSFSPFKVCISGLYKRLAFTLVEPYQGKPVVLDDTVYFLPANSREQAVLLHRLLNSEPSLRFLKSMIFWDAKRPITGDILSRLDIAALARENGVDPRDLATVAPAAPAKQGLFD